MQTQDKKLFLDMQEHPENYSDQELEAMMDDLDHMPDVDLAWQEFNSQHTAIRTSRRWLQIAAVFAGIILLSGIVLAAWQLSNKNDKKVLSANTEMITTQNPIEAQDSIVRFDNVRLDSVLTIVAQHYKKQVDCRNEAVRNLHFHIEWNQAAPLSDFITLINNFEGVSLREEQDTIIAE